MFLGWASRRLLSGEGVVFGVLVPDVFDLVGGGLGYGLAVEAGDDVEGHVDAGGDAGGGDDGAVVDPAGLADPVHVGAGFGGLGPVGFVGGGGSAIEEAGGGQEGGAVADGHGEWGAGGGLFQPGEGGGVLQEFADAEAAGDEEEVERWGVGEGVIGDEGDALGGGDGAFFRGEGDDFYAILEVAPDFEGAGGVEEFEAGEEEDAEVFWGVLGGEGGGEE